MTAVEALGRLRALGVPVVTTADAAIAFGLRIDAASQALRRLRGAGLVLSVKRGLWAISALPDRMLLAEYLTAPYPAYVSLQSALCLHGVIGQIPQVTYVVSLARSANVRTPVATYSIHHVPPELFGGFDRDARTGVKVARPAKALFDVLYLSGTRVRLFRALPELAIRRGFRVGEVRWWIARIPSRRLRAMTVRRLEELLGREVGRGGAQPRDRVSIPLR